MTPSRPDRHPCPTLFDTMKPRRWLLTGTRPDGTHAEVIVYATTRNLAWDRAKECGLYTAIVGTRRAP